MSQVVVLLRHGVTAGNREGRYIGVTDEPLCPEGRMQLKQFAPPPVDAVYTSPLLRCRETAGILFPGMEPTIVPGLREMNFGVFEGKNYGELKDDPAYCRWLDSGGAADIPNGEKKAAFCARCRKAFLTVMAEERRTRVAFVVHGGTIMAVQEALALPKRDFYYWQVSNGRGFLCQWDGKILADVREVQYGA